ncbi:unnamed protein product [Gadus morhua 'NCC']
MTPSDPIRPPQTSSDHLGPPQTASDHLRPPQTTSDLQRLQTSSDLHRPPQTPSDRLCPLMQDMSQLEFLYLSNNHLSYIPTPLPESLRALHLQSNNIQSLQEDTFCNAQDRSYSRPHLEDIRLDANPIHLRLFASSYACLPRLPLGGR